MLKGFFVPARHRDQVNRNLCNALFLAEILWSSSGFCVLKWLAHILLSLSPHFWKEANETAHCAGLPWAKELNSHEDSRWSCHIESVRHLTGAKSSPSRDRNIRGLTSTQKRTRRHHDFFFKILQVKGTDNLMIHWAKLKCFIFYSSYCYGELTRNDYSDIV